MAAPCLASSSSGVGIESVVGSVGREHLWCGGPVLEVCAVQPKGEALDGCDEHVGRGAHLT